MAEDITRTLQDGRLIFRNFAGKAGPYNTEGSRNFGVILDDATAKLMEAEGWNVRYLNAREEDDEPTPWLKVTVKFRNNKGEKTRPPRAVLLSSKGREQLGEDEINILDWCDIQTVDLIVRQFSWDVQGKQGINAYLQSIYVTINEDELELKYANINPRTGEVDHDEEGLGFQ